MLLLLVLASGAPLPAVAEPPLVANWTELDPQLEPVWGTPSHIGVRYSHGAISHAGKMVVSHGYFYNHKKHKPAWQSDTWAFDPSDASWAKLHNAWHDGEALAPSPRYSFSSLAYNDSLLMFGERRSPAARVQRGRAGRVWRGAKGGRRGARRVFSEATLSRSLSRASSANAL
jgi:hypothetical protein